VVEREVDGNPPELAADVREALGELQRYLSDSIAPLMVAEAMELLFDYPVELAAFEINAWTAAQYRGRMGAVPVSDYLFHAVDKIHQLGQYRLVPEERLSRYLGALVPAVVEQCPEEDRDLLRGNLARLGEGSALLAAPVDMLHRQLGSQGSLASNVPGAAGAAGAAPAPPEAVAKSLKRFALLLERWEAAGGPKAGPGGAAETTAAGTGTGRPPAPGDEKAGPSAAARKKDEALLSQLLATAAGGATSDGELAKSLEKLRRIGLEMQTAEAFRVLGRSLPGWFMPPGVEAADQSGSTARGSASAAIRRIVTLPEDPTEVAKRFGEMLQAAVEQLNAGSLPRAVKMFEVADKLIAEKRVEPAAVEVARRKAFDALDFERLRSLQEEPDKHGLLRKILEFFPGLRIPALLDGIRMEEKRERRRLLLSLLEVHGPEARAAALEGLQALVLSGAPPSQDWHFKRNLLYVLRRLPRAADQPLETEMDLLTRLSEPGLPPPLVKEAIAALGQIRHERAEAILISRIHGLEQILLKKGDAPFDEAELQPLLDRAVATLAKTGTPTARRAVVEHGLKKKGPLGDAAARLSELGAQDLSDDPELVALLVRHLRGEMPFKVLGLVLKKDEEKLAHLIDALAGTATQEVRQAFEQIVESFPKQEFAAKAAKALSGFDAKAGGEPLAASLQGDLELFELPSLLQSLGVSEVTGVLTLRDRKAAAVGSISLEKGKVRTAQIGLVKGDDACYQFFERPFPGTFSFVKQDLPPRRDTDPPPREIVPILLEGMRRYDELQRLAALVPDELYVTASGTKPNAHPEEPDAVLQQQVWSRAAAGASPRLCEESIAADSFRIRRLFAHWFEEGSLKPV
jgi:hypothetical protein